MTLNLLCINSFSQEYNCENYLLQYDFSISAANDWANLNNIPILTPLPTESDLKLSGFRFGKPIYSDTDNLNSSYTSSTNKVQIGGISDLNLTGEGIIIGVWDSGSILNSHDGLFDEFGNPQTTWMENLIIFGTPHATHIAGTLISDGINPYSRGMATNSHLLIWGKENDLYEMCTAVEEYELILSNHSYGQISGWKNYNGNFYWFGDTEINQNEDYKFGYYDSKAKGYDEIAYNNPQYLIIKSAGNDRNDFWGNVQHFHFDDDNIWYDIHERDCGHDGYDCIAGDKTAKNILTVGSILDISNGYQHPSDIILSAFSSFGPTDDGRIKPDIVANGENLLSTWNADNDSYNELSGTSMASASVTGSLALIQEYYSGLNGGEYLNSAALKALLFHTADPSSDGIGPNYKVGWGLLNVESAVNLIANDDINIITGTILNQETLEWPINLSNSEPVKITLVWTDPPGTPVESDVLNNNTPMLVNDLDIRIYNDEVTYFPFILDPQNPNMPPTTGDNSIDNVEQINLLNPNPSQYLISLKHKNELVNGSQNFALIISKAGPSTNIQFMNAYNGENIPTTTLNIYDLYGNLIFDEIQSGEVKSLHSSLTYTVKTNHNTTFIEGVGKVSHYNWNGDESSNKIDYSFIATPEINSQTAIFKNIKPIILKTNSNEFNNNFNIEIRDPWYIEPEDGDSNFCTACLQLNQFHALNEVTNPEGVYYVFLNQDPHTTELFYSIHAPQFINSVELGQLYKFDFWEFTNVATFDDIDFPDQENYKIANFMDENAEVYARYICMGDINGDSVLNVNDFVIIVYRILEASFYNDIELKRCDVNEDGYINILDIIALIDVLLGNGFNENTLPNQSSEYNLLSKLMKNEHNLNSLVLYMKNNEEVKGIQMKIKLPSGFKADSMLVNSHANNMTLSYSINEGILYYQALDQLRKFSCQR